MEEAEKTGCNEKKLIMAYLKTEPLQNVGKYVGGKHMYLLVVTGDGSGQFRLDKYGDSDVQVYRSTEDVDAGEVFKQAQCKSGARLKDCLQVYKDSGEYALGKRNCQHAARDAYNAIVNDRDKVSDIPNGLLCALIQ